MAEFPSARKLQQQGLLTNHPSQLSLTNLINHFTQGNPRQSMAYLQQQQQQQGQIARHSGGHAIVGNGQQGVSQLQGHLLSQLQHGAVAQAHRDPSISKIPQFSNHVQSQLRGQMDSRSFTLAQQGGQALNNQMQPPGPLQLSGNAGSLTPGNAVAGPLQAQLTSTGLLQAQGQAPSQALSGGSGGNAHSLPGSQVHLQLNHAQALSQLQGQSTAGQVPAGSHGSPNFVQPSQQMIQGLPKQATLQPAGQVVSQSHSLNQVVVNGVQQSLPGTPQSEMSDLRSTA